jgi:hypothetical protein
MSGTRRKQPRGRPRADNKPRPVDLWRPVPQLPPPAPIAPATDPAALVRSLGHPPLAEQSVVAEHYLAAVVERAAGLALALAASGDLLAADERRDEPVI